jgi:hypothetical protein
VLHISTFLSHFLEARMNADCAKWYCYKVDWQNICEMCCCQNSESSYSSATPVPSFAIPKMKVISDGKGTNLMAKNSQVIGYHLSY